MASPSNSQSKGTRKSLAIFGLGEAISPEDAVITGAHLPTRRQVLCCMMYHTNVPNKITNVNRSQWEAARLVLNQLVVFYGKANIPMISELKACERIIQLLKENAKLRAIPKERRSNASVVSRINAMEASLCETFPLWPADVERLIANAEDMAFLHSMKTNRTATFGSKDSILDKKIQRSNVRKQLAQRRAVKEKQKADEEGEETATQSLSDTDISNEGEFDMNFETPKTNKRCHHRSSHTGASAFIPHDIY